MCNWKAINKNSIKRKLAICKLYSIYTLQGFDKECCEPFLAIITPWSSTRDCLFDHSNLSILSSSTSRIPWSGIMVQVLGKFDTPQTSWFFPYGRVNHTPQILRVTHLWCAQVHTFDLDKDLERIWLFWCQNLEPISKEQIYLMKM